MENVDKIEADMKSCVLDSEFVDPTDDRLITRYLRNKIANQYVPPCLITDVLDLYRYHPKDLAALYPSHDSLYLSHDDEWYFFSLRDPTEKRAAGSGYWKATGVDKPVNNVNDQTVGFKQEFVFYEGKEENETNWIMHEYKDVENSRQRTSSSNDNMMMLDDWVLCRIYYDLEKQEKEEEEEKQKKEEEEGPHSKSGEPNPAEEYSLVLLHEPAFTFPRKNMLLGFECKTFEQELMELMEAWYSDLDF